MISALWLTVAIIALALGIVGYMAYRQVKRLETSRTGKAVKNAQLDIIGLGEG